MNEKLIFEGKKYSKKELANKFGIKYGTFITKLSRGWTLEEIKNGYRQNGCSIEIDGIIYKTKKEACDKLNLNYRQLNNKINNKQCGIEIDGIIYKTKKEACDKLNLNYRQLNNKINNKQVNDKIQYTINGNTFYSKKEIADFYHINYHSFLNKLSLGWTIYQIVGVESPPNKIDLNEINLEELSSINNIDKNIIISRLKKGYTLEKAIKPIDKQKSSIICDNKLFYSITEMAKFYNVPVKLIYNRLSIGWTPEEAVEIKKRKR